MLKYCLAAVLAVAGLASPALAQDDPEPFTGPKVEAVAGTDGGLILGGGATNLVGLKFGDFFLSSGQHLAGYDGQPIDVAGYEFETEVSQAVFKGSIALTYGGIGQSAYFQGGIIYTDFLKDAGVDNYVTPFAGLGLKLGRGVVRLGYSADLADDFTIHRGEVELRLAM